MLSAKRDLETDLRNNQILAKKINEYWLSRGFLSRARPKKQKFGNGHRKQIRHVIVSETHNGYPVKKQAR